MKPKTLLLISTICALLSSPVSISKSQDIPQNQTVILDPGHGGLTDSGTRFARVYEDEINYDITVRVRKLLLDVGYSVHQTVSDAETGFSPQDSLANSYEEFLVDHNGQRTKLTGKFLEKRCNIIRSFSKEDHAILVSIHTNYLPSSSSGALVYYPNPNEGKSQDKTNSQILADAISDSFIGNGISTYSIDLKIIRIYLPQRTKVENDFLIFKSTGSLEAKVLIECGNIKNRTDRARLLNPQFREEIAYAIYEGITLYLSQQQ